MRAVEPDFGALGEQRGQRPRAKRLHTGRPEGIGNAARDLRITRPGLGCKAQHRDGEARVAHLVRAGHAWAERQRDRAQFGGPRSEEHTSELQSLMRISYAVFCLKKKKNMT